MPDPLQSLRQNARSRRNLKVGGQTGGGRHKQTKAEREIQKLAKKLLDDPQYRKTLVKQLRQGNLHPSVHVMLYYYAHGKPAEIIEDKRIIPVRLVHEYAKE